MPRPQDEHPLLEASGVTVTFGGVTALSDCSLDVSAGGITGLIGPNGAGKTTLFNVLSGLQPPDRGTVSFDGEDISDVPAFRRGRIGMARTFQRLEVFGSLTAYENILVGAEIRQQWSADREADPRAEAEALIDLVGLRGVRDERVDAIPTGHARLVELGRALSTRPKLVLLDEPSSGLDETETEFFGDVLLELASGGLGILLVEHDVDLVMRVCDHIHVLDFGQIIARGTPTEIQSNARVQVAYLGEEEDGAA